MVVVENVSIHYFSFGEQFSFFDDPVVAKHVLGGIEVSVRVLDILIQIRAVVVKGVRGGIVPLGLRRGRGHDQLVLVSFLADLDAPGGRRDVLVDSEVGHGVVDGVAERRLLVLELRESGGRVDRVRRGLSLDVSRGRAQSLLRSKEMRGSALHVCVEVGREVVIGVLRGVVILGFRLGRAHLHLVLVAVLSDFEIVHRVGVFLLSAEAGNGIVNWITERRFSVVGHAAARAANGIIFSHQLDGLGAV